MPASAPLRLLFIGDVVGRAGRQAVKKVLPGLRQQLQLNAVFLNAENIAHGNGVTTDTVREMLDCGVDFCTSGNHIWDNKEGVDYLQRSDAKVLRPANFPAVNPGRGLAVVEVGSKRILLINLIGQVFMPQQVSSPFEAFDALVARHNLNDYQAVVVDFHAEATSEKQALAWYCDGRASLLVGTHTHVPTADLRTFPGGTGLVCDIGCVAPANSVIGADKTKVLKRFLTQTPVALSPVDDEREILFYSIYAEIDPDTRKTLKLERVDRTVQL